LRKSRTKTIQNQQTQKQLKPADKTTKTIENKKTMKNTAISIEIVI
jgi:hypothetical protein